MRVPPCLVVLGQTLLMHGIQKKDQLIYRLTIEAAHYCIFHKKKASLQLGVSGRLLQLHKLGHGHFIPQMPLQQLVRHQPLRHVAHGIHKRDVVVDLADALQLVGVPVVVRAAVDANQEDGDVRPRVAQQVELKLVHVRRLAVEQQQQAQHGRLRAGLPAVDGVVRRRRAVLLKVQALDALPARHDARAAAKLHIGPHRRIVAMVQHAHVRRVVGKRGELVAAPVMAVVDHGVDKAPDNGLGDICRVVLARRRASGPCL